MHNEIDVRKVVSQHFADTWLTVAMNDYEQYQTLMREASVMGVAELSQHLQQDWENLVEQVVEKIETDISEIAGLYFRELLQGYGSLPFDLIAREVRAKWVDTWEGSKS